MIPARRGHHPAPEVVEAIDVGVAELLEDTRARVDDLGIDDTLRARLLVLDGDVVQLRRDVPVDRDDARVEATAVSDVVPAEYGAD